MKHIIIDTLDANEHLLIDPENLRYIIQDYALYSVIELDNFSNTVGFTLRQDIAKLIELIE